MSLNSILCIRNTFGYCYHLVNGISYGLAQSDPIKRCLFYLILVFGTENNKEILNRNQGTKKALKTNLFKEVLFDSLYLFI